MAKRLKLSIFQNKKLFFQLFIFNVCLTNRFFYKRLMKQRKNIKHFKRANNSMDLKRIKINLGRLAEKV